MQKWGIRNRQFPKMRIWVQNIREQNGKLLQEEIWSLKDKNKRKNKHPSVCATSLKSTLGTPAESNSHFSFHYRLHNVHFATPSLVLPWYCISKEKGQLLLTCWVSPSVKGSLVETWNIISLSLNTVYTDSVPVWAWVTSRPPRKLKKNQNKIGGLWY